MSVDLTGALGRRRVIAAGAIAVLMLASGAARAAHTGLVIIPTAETVGADHYIIEPQFDGTFPPRRAETRILNTEFGLGDRCEAGVDFDLSRDPPTRLLFNAKYLLLAGGAGTPALAVGVTNVGHDVRSAPHLVATLRSRALRGHLGAARIEGETRWFFGADHALSGRLTLMADYTSGQENFSSAGISYRHSEALELLVGAQFANADDGDTRFTAHLVITGTYRRARGGR